MTRTRLGFVLSLIVLIGLIGAGCYYYLNKPGDKVAGAGGQRINVGWQTAWSQQGQVIQALNHTNITKLRGLNLNLVGFLFGPDLNEAANTGSLDITNAGIVPVINLFAANPDWVIIGRQVDFHVCIVAGPGTGIESVAGLAGKRFAVPIGGGSHPFAISLLRQAGLAEGTGPNQVEVLNVKPSEMPLAMKAGQVDAIASWDPTTTLATDNGGKVVTCARYVGFIVANKTFAEANREQIVHLLEAYGMAYFYAAQHKADVNRWFADASKINPVLVNRLEVLEPNLHASTLDQIRLVPSVASLDLAQKVADTMLSLHLINSAVNVRDRMDLTFAQQAERWLSQNKSEYASVSANAAP